MKFMASGERVARLVSRALEVFLSSRSGVCAVEAAGRKRPPALIVVDDNETCWLRSSASDLRPPDIPATAGSR